MFVKKEKLLFENYMQAGNQFLNEAYNLKKTSNFEQALKELYNAYKFFEKAYELAKRNYFYERTDAFSLMNIAKKDYLELKNRHINLEK